MRRQCGWSWDSLETQVEVEMHYKCIEIGQYLERLPDVCRKDAPQIDPEV
jgi:hypothetical protein